jgi:hypothetical protein
VPIHKISSRPFLISRYQKPKAKACLVINMKIIAEIITGIIPFPLAYQHTNAITGEMNAILTLPMPKGRGVSIFLSQTNL